jgi:type VI secretion system protein ImpG
MVTLLHHYEQELGRLRQATRQYADAHPTTAAALELGADACTDPEVERLLQSVALLNASMKQLIEEGRSDFHKALLQTLQPHYLRAIPACGIIQVDTSAARPNEIGTVSRLPRGTILRSDASKFVTSGEVCIAPLSIASARFQPTLDLPATLRLPGEATSALCISLQATASSVSLDQPPMPMLRLCVDGDAGQRAGLLDAILLHSQCVCLEAGANWSVLPHSPFTLAGMGIEEALLPRHPGQQSPRLLTEFFHLPQKFGFIDLDLQAISASCPPGCKQLTLHIVLPACDPRLRHASAANFRLSCAPVINFFPQAAAPIRMDGRSEAYPVTPSQPGLVIYSIDKVSLMSRNGDRALQPIHGTSHTEPGPYWQLDESEGFALHFVDREQRPARLETGVISVQLTCTNTELPKPASRLTTEASAGGFPIRFTHAPATARRLASPGALCESLYAEDTSLPALRMLLQLHGCTCTESLKSLAAKPTTAWLNHPMGRIHMHGTEFTLLVDQAALRAHSIHVLAEILLATLADKLRENRFAQLRIASEMGHVLCEAGPRAGTRPLA